MSWRHSRETPLPARAFPRYPALMTALASLHALLGLALLIAVPALALVGMGGFFRPLPSRFYALLRGWPGWPSSRSFWAFSYSSRASGPRTASTSSTAFSSPPGSTTWEAWSRGRGSTGASRTRPGAPRSTWPWGFSSPWGSSFGSTSRGGEAPYATPGGPKPAWAPVESPREVFARQEPKAKGIRGAPWEREAAPAWPGLDGAQPPGRAPGSRPGPGGC